MITEDQYIEISRLTDEILTSTNASPAKVAIQRLHLTSASPSLLKSYENIFDNGIISYFRIIFTSIRNKLSLLAVLTQSILISLDSQWSRSVKTLSGIDVLFVSHLLNKSQYEQEEDFYFSDIPKELQGNGYTSLVALINHTGSEFIIDNANSVRKHKLVLPRRLKFNEEIKILSLLWEEHNNLIKEMRLEKNKTKKNVLLFAAIEMLSSSSLTSLRIAAMITKLIKILQPKVLITTFEGHAWERVVYNAVRQVKPNIKCIGYTHAPIFEKQHAVKRCLSKMYNPDLILNSGNTQKKQLESAKLLNDIPIKVLGSVRCFEASVENFVSQTKRQLTSNEKQYCLVAPEGIKSEIDILFEFSLDCAKKMSEVVFIWRLHPIFSFNKFSYMNNIFKSLPSNIILSEKDLQEDFETCQWVLYRGSSVVIQAVVAGLKPIYLHRSGEIKIDPIYEIKKWKNEIETVKDAMETLKKGAGNYEDYVQAKKYCLDMYTPLDYGLLIDTLRKMNSNE